MDIKKCKTCNGLGEVRVEDTDLIVGCFDCNYDGIAVEHPQKKRVADGKSLQDAIKDSMTTEEYVEYKKTLEDEIANTEQWGTTAPGVKGLERVIQLSEQPSIEQWESECIRLDEENQALQTELEELKSYIADFHYMFFNKEDYNMDEIRNHAFKGEDLLNGK